MATSKVLVFGPQALGFNAVSFARLHSNIQGHNLEDWAAEAFASVSAALDSLATTSKNTELKTIVQKSPVDLLASALRTGELPATLFPLPNSLLSPLVVLAQLIDYLHLLKRSYPDLEESDNLPKSLTNDTETLGLCIGVLSAFAVSSSATVADLKRHGAVAVRLAVLCGVLVDAEDASRPSAEQAVSFSASWTATSLDSVNSVLERHPQSYLSVQMDEKRGTITCPQQVADRLQQSLKGVGVHSTPVTLKGRFHWPGHQSAVDEAMDLISRESSFHLGDASGTVIPTRSNCGGNYLQSGSLSTIALGAIMTEHSAWFQTVELAHASQQSSSSSKWICFGPERCIPPTIARQLGSRLMHTADASFSLEVPSGVAKVTNGPGMPIGATDADDRVAVIGMSCHLPNAEDLDAFWQVLLSGESQHREVPPERFSMKSHFREADPHRKWYGNFIQDYDAFDHKFFKKSPREMGSTDPQHRVALQLAYQAVQQSGYFGVRDAEFDKHKHIGVYVGHANTDYEHNVRCYPANAYSATGNLKSLLAGKISHYFGWTGPSLTLDTACSSSSVAVHLACRAILSGEITGALAGGVNILTSPEWYHNLAGASFLSRTGQCKSFDASGDGYCRGEGSGMVFLKRLSTAIADGDQILGVIASTSVLQNQNCTPITVPNSTSLEDLFRSVIRRSGVNPADITVVEAHGTGTAVGDPAEYDGIRRALGGPQRPNKLSLTAVKGSIGHLEVASGVASLIKVLLMIHKAAVPPQASFRNINPSLNAKPEDNMEISTSVKAWNPAVRAALINNYGASGSNASMVVTEPPKSFAKIEVTEAVAVSSSQSSDGKQTFPFWIGGNDDNSLKAYSGKLRRLVLQETKSASAVPLTLANLSFQVSRQSNRNLGQGLILQASSLDDLCNKLAAFESGSGSGIVSVKRSQSQERPVILCFGGQVSTFVGLDKQVFDTVAVLRKRLDECNAMCLSLGLESIYPAIFQKAPLSDIVQLQTTLFAMQFSCAKAWIDCGIQVAAIVGHSFGELTGLCVSGVLSLRDALKLISQRARIIKESWPTEKGAMMAVEGDLDAVQRLIADVHIKTAEDKAEVSIACYNGPRSFTLAGSVAAIQAAESVAKNNANDAFKGLRVKVLNVTNAFHCSLVDTLKGSLEILGQSLAFRKPTIRLERATEHASTGPIGGDHISRHLRDPVFFHQAITRLTKDYPDAVWLEAGSNSTVTNMASKAIAGVSKGHFQSVNITSTDSFGLLVDATLNLWRQGVDVTFWAHHKLQLSEYTPVLLPPYQFEKSRHWLDIKQVPVVTEVKEVSSAPATAVEEPERGLFTFAGFLDEAKHSVRFRVNTNTAEFKQMVDAHIMANTVAVMPGMLPVEIAIEAMSTIIQSQYQPELRGLVYYSPLVPHHCAAVFLDAQITGNDASGLTWEWKFVGVDSKGASTRHMSGSLVFQHPNDQLLQSEFARLARLGSHKRCKRLLDGGEADDVVVGRNIYRAFEAVIDYKDLYRHVTKLVGKDGDSAGRVVRAHEKDGQWLDSVLTDCFCQVAGVAVNLFSDTADFAERGIYIGDRVDRWIRAPGLLSDDDPSKPKPKEWEVFAMSHRDSDTAFVSDVFAFDARTGLLHEAILGIRYSRVPIAGIRKALNRTMAENPIASKTKTPVSFASVPSPPGTPPPQLFPSSIPNIMPQPQFSQQVPSPNPPIAMPTVVPTPAPQAPQVNGVNGGSQFLSKTKAILGNLSGVEVEDMNEDSDLVEMGIDSLMAMELIREVQSAFKCTLETDQLMQLTDLRSLVTCITTILGVDVEASPDSHVTTNGTGNTNGITQAQVNGHVPNGINGVNGHSHTVKQSTPAQGATLVPETVRNVLRAIKASTDDFILDFKMADYYTRVRPITTTLCAAYIVEAFEKLGCSLRNARPGEHLPRISGCLPKHDKFMRELYKIIGPGETGLVDFVGSDMDMVRTAVPCPAESAETLLQRALRDEPDHAAEFRLSALTGCKLAECLTGQQDGLQIIFGSAEGRKTVSDVYAVAPLNYAWIKQAEAFLSQLLQRLPSTTEPIKILEMGAGTGGTTATLVPMLANLGLPVIYTFTDLSSSLVAAARKRFKQYPVVEFKVLNIEASPDPAFVHSQHIVVANACVHATRSLPISLTNIHRILRPDGLVMLLEETEQLPWVDFVFGLLEGWWLFEDGRVHAQVTAEHWERELRGAGFGHVDYTDGERREAQVQRIIFGFASDIRYAGSALEPSSSFPVRLRHAELTSMIDRQAVIDELVQKYTTDFSLKSASGDYPSNSGFALGSCVLVTGATGSLGSHIVSAAADMSTVSTVVCINRPGTIDVESRQQDAFEMRGINLQPSSRFKLLILEADTSKPMLGLPRDMYQRLVQSVTHIVHNAWPMSLTRTTKAYETQFQVMRNLIDLAAACAALRPATFRFSFQFISSIGAVGYYPLWTGRSLAPELPSTADNALPVGYADAKIVCERMLDATLRRHPDRFRGMSVRIAQITGSTTNGYWNPIEHFSFFIKSSKFLRILPDLQGTLSWSPVNDVASSLLDIVLCTADPHAVYHIENPARQPWPEMIQVLARELEIPRQGIVTYEEWLERVRSCNAPISENPAKQLMSFWETHFLRMSTGPLILDTKNSREHSRTMRESGPVEEDLVKLYIRRWEQCGYL